MKASWDIVERHWIADHGWVVDKDGMLVLTEKQFSEYFWAGYSDMKNVQTLTLPSVHGVCLLFEGIHFRIEKC